MSQTLKQRVLLREVCRIGNEPKRLVDGMPWNSSATHNTSDAFRERQIARGMVPKEKKP